MKNETSGIKSRLSNEENGVSVDALQGIVGELREQLQQLDRENKELLQAKELAERQLNTHLSFYNSAPSGYFTLDRDGIILELNQSARKLLKSDQENLRGVKVTEFLLPESIQVFNNFLESVFESKEKVECQVEVCSSIGILSNIHVEGIALADGTKCLVDMVDALERLAIKEQLDESEFKYRLHLENLNDGVGIVDGNANFLYINPAAEQILGITAGELLNRNLKEFIGLNEFLLLQHETRRYLNSEKSRFEIEITLPTGQKRTILISGSPYLNTKGERLGTLAIFTDITEKKEGECELQRRLKLELIVSEISNDFVHLKREYLDLSVNRALQKIGRFAGVDRSYLFLFSEDHTLCSNTHEWCDEGIESQIENLKDVPVEMLPWWMKKLHEFETIHIPLVSEMPEEASAEKEILESQDIKSLLVIPLLTVDSLIGFIGFDAVRSEKTWFDSDILLLNMLGEILGNGFNRLKFEEDLSRVNSILEQKVEERTSELKEQLELNQAIVGHVGLLVIATDQNGIIKSFNPFAERMLGYQASEVIGKCTPLIFHDPEEIKSRSNFNLSDAERVGMLNFIDITTHSLKDGKYTHGNEWIFVRKDGSRFNVLLTVSKLEDDHGQALGYVGVAIDITDRKEAERVQIKTMQNLTILIQNLQAGTLFEDERRHIYMVNQSFCDLFSIPYPPDTLVGFDCAVASENSKSMMLDPEGFIDRINEIISRREIVSNDELTLKDGRVFERDYIPILYNDELIGHLWQYRDISDRKQNERYAILQRNLGFNLAVTTTIDQALTQVIHSTLQIEGIHMAGIYIINPETEELELLVESGLSQTSKEQVLKYCKNSLQYSIVQKGEPVYGFYDEIVNDKALLQDEGIKQLGIMPIRHEEKIIGSINIGSKSEERFKYAAKLSLEMISAQIGGTLARINMENALRLSQRNFHLMFDTIDDFMFILDPEGKIIKTNPVVERRLGYTTEELQGLSVLEVHPPERRQEAAFIVGEMIAGRLETCPVPLYKKNGGIIPVETKVVIGKWDGRDALYGISRDISERIRAEETLRESEARWHFALEGSGDGVWDWNIKNNEMFFSAQWKTMLGYTDSEIGNTLDEWEKRVHPDDLHRCFSDLEKHLSGATEVYVNEHRILCKDGQYKWILDRGKVVDRTSEGKPLRIIGTHTDITQRKLYEVQLQKAIEKEKELNELKSRFVSTASHEFRTPLASMLMLSDTLISYQQKMDVNQISTRLGKIKDNVLHLTKIVNDVLQLSKMQEGKIGFNPAEEDLVKLCIDLIDGFNTTIFVKGQITFHSVFKSLIVKIDNRLIVQSVSNLISNAIKYSNSNSIVEVELYQQNHEICISVKDYGIGIPEEDQKHLFTPFFRARNSSTIQGNGLGLSIVMESMQMHSGKVSFASKDKEGSMFILHFPESITTSSELNPRS